MSELKVVIGMNEGKVLCISNDKRIIKSAMFDYLFETNQEFDVDFFELRNWGEYDIEIFNYEHQPTLNGNQQIVLEYLKNAVGYEDFNGFQAIYWMLNSTIHFPESELSVAYKNLDNADLRQILQEYSQWALEQEEE